MIRLATSGDKDTLITLAKEFTKEGGNYFEFNREKLEYIASLCIESEDGLAIVYEKENKVVGMLVAMCNEHIMFGYRHTTELCWYVLKEHRGGIAPLRLMKAFIEWSKFKQAVYMMVADYPFISDLARFYKLLGFEPAERTFIRKV